jgi:predicted transcriptional regulator
MIEELEEQLKAYQRLKTGRHKANLDLIDVLPEQLIKARIALNWTQKYLAMRVGTSEQQIQRYEASDYQTASLATIRRISYALRGQSVGSESRI